MMGRALVGVALFCLALALAVLRLLGHLGDPTATDGLLVLIVVLAAGGAGLVLMSSTDTP